eukprot:TRINITY_DN1297_c0_g1_i4.p1 TRINITY_DN1297_c0_g1~~TRINITY_DN1297_c0_g1_i4.p1  ORF type:complete len:311 (-),score=43.23 TRINITY_DN1297_c0_g1_i4:83-1015(-)
MSSRFKPNIVVSPLVHEFPSEEISVQEGKDFFDVSQVAIPENRPYIWTNTVQSLDGVISFWEKEQSEASEIAMAHIPNSGAKSDWRLLNFGFATADAIIVPSRRHHSLVKIYIPEYLEYRNNILKKEGHPIQVLVTSRGEFDLTEPRFSDKTIKTIIFTTDRGLRNLANNIRSLYGASLDPKSDEQVIAYLEEDKNIIVKDFGSETKPNSVDLPKMCYYLRTVENVKTMEVSAGGNTISQFLHHKMLDETRYTTSGQLCGLFNSMGEHRPLFFDPSFCYSSRDSPLLHFVGYRLHGHHHFFARGVWQYRH